MAAPTVQTTNTTSISTASDPWTVNMPASIAFNDMLVVFGRTGGAQTFNLPAGWNWAVQNNVADATDDATSVIWRRAAGGDTLSWDMSGSAKGATTAYRIAGHNNEVVVPTPTTFTTAANSGDPPATGTLPLDDYLILVWIGFDGETQTISAAPTNYVNLLTQNSGSGGLPATNCRVGSAQRELTGITSEDPGVFTHGAAGAGGCCVTIAIREAVTPVKAVIDVYPEGQAVKHASIR